MHNHKKQVQVEIILAQACGGTVASSLFYAGSKNEFSAS